MPSARFFGTVTLNGVDAPQGATITASVGGVACGFSTAAAGHYSVDVQAIQGCIAPGSTVSFTVAGQPATASPAAVLPPIPGTAVAASLAASAATPAPTVAPTTPPAPPSPPAAPTTRPTTAPTQAPPPPPTAAPRPSATVAQSGAQRPSGPAAQRPSVGVSQKPGASAPAPAGRPGLPNTGTGGLQGTNSGTTGIALLGMLLGVITLGATGFAFARRGR